MQNMIRSSLILLCFLCVTPINAQSVEPIGAINAETFRPALDREGIIDVESAEVRSHMDYDLGIYMWYANRPLLLVQRADTTQRVSELVKDRIGLSLMGSVSLAEWLELGLELPFMLYQTGETNIPRLPSDLNLARFSNGGVFGLGDIRFMPKVGILHQDRHGINLSLNFNIGLPTAQPTNEYLGHIGLWTEPTLAISRAGQNGFKWAFNVGAVFRETYQAVNLDIGNDITTRLGMSYNLYPKTKIPLGFDVSTRLNLQYAPNFAEAESVHENAWEVNGGIHYDWNNNVQLNVGAGTALITGPGTPDFRIFGGLRFAPENRPNCPDRDGDYVCDIDDACPDQSGAISANGCPQKDTDNDGVWDVDDKCPEDFGKDKHAGCPLEDMDLDGISNLEDMCPKQSGPNANRGCPADDRDGDLIIDAKDACPEIPGPELLNGCPDTDGDGIADNLDKCPEEPEVINEFEDDDGCPDEGAEEKTDLTPGKIELKETVFFRSGSSTIKDESHGLLNQVAQTLINHKEIKRVRIEGHTDSRGDAEQNKALSKKRARSVLRYLIRKGVDRSRLRHVGYGEEKPLESNYTWQGRASNRRVEFFIVEYEQQLYLNTPQTKSNELKRPD